jgi:hypothetical protein
MGTPSGFSLKLDNPIRRRARARAHANGRSTILCSGDPAIRRQMSGSFDVQPRRVATPVGSTTNQRARRDVGSLILGYLPLLNNLSEGVIEESLGG